MIDSKKLEQLVSIARELNKVSDEFSFKQKQAEDAIINTRIGISVWIDIGPDIKLGYSKLGGRWCLAIRIQNMEWPLLEAPRHLRVKIGKTEISLLMNELTKEAVNYALRIKEANKDLKILIGQFREIGLT